MTAMENYQELRQRVEKRIEATDNKVRIVLQLSKCSMAVGAGDVLERIEQVSRRLGLDNLDTKIVGCTGLCSKEPIMTVKSPGKEEVVYSKVTPDRAELIILNHVLRGVVIKPWVIQ